MTLTKQLKKSTKKKQQQQQRNNQQVNGETTLPVKNRASITEAAILPGIVPVKMSKDPPTPVTTLEQESGIEGGKQETAEPTTGPKLERKPSLRRKLGSLLRGSADLPAAINRGLQPIRRSMSFGKGIEQKPPPQPNATAAQPKNSAFKAFRTRSVQWYNSLSSLAENDETKGHLADSEERIFHEDDSKEDSPGARIMKEFGVNFQIVVENVFGLMLCVSFFTKMAVAIIFENNRKEVYNMISNHIDTMRDPEEAKILQEHYDYGIRYTIFYEASLVIFAILFHVFHIAIIVFDYFVNESNRTKMIPFYMEYFVDEEKYFYYISIHLMVCYIGFFIILFAFDGAFIMQVQHVCALFNIVTMRLESTSTCEVENKLTDLNKKLHSRILSAITLHLEVLQMVSSIERIYNVCWFIILVENMVGFGAGLYILYSYTHDPLEVAKYSTIFAGTIIHFYVMFSQGQQVIDSSSRVFDACYNCPWYNWNKPLRQMLFIIMARSLKPCNITGGSVFVISMETYGKMVKTGFSCYAVCKMREDFA